MGIYRYQYALRGIPEGKRLQLRVQPDRKSKIVGSLSRSATGIWIRDCQPYVDSFTFEEASRERKMQMLAGSWCEIEFDNLVGFVPGAFLDPLPLAQ